jgi:large subunit ribosomal protein L18
MNRLVNKLQTGLRRQHRVRSRMHGSAERPRLSVNISNKHISAQIINDETHLTLVGFSTAGKKKTGTKTELAEYVGTEIAKLAKAKKIKKVVLDRGSKAYHGRVKALADAARKEGLEF